MRRVAFLTASCMIAGRAETRDDHWEHDLEFPPLRVGCAGAGIELEAVVWDDPALAIDRFDAFVVGTTWDYPEKPARFGERLAAIAERRPLFNPLPTLRWNLHKSYLRDLAACGVAVVPTLWRQRADAESIHRAFDELDAEEIVVKPVVGAGAWRQVRLGRGDTLPPAEELPPAETMVQPFLPAVASEGEYSLVFFGRRFSHCALKVPVAGDYRVQSIFGGTEVPCQPSEAELATARAVVDAVEGPLLYARVDMVRHDGKLLLMELELVEPYLYPEQGPDMGTAFAAALAESL